MGKGNSWLYIGSIGLVIAAIAVTTVIDRSKSQQEDIRAKADVNIGLAATAVVSSVNEATGTLLVTNFQIGQNGAATSGVGQTWTITIPSDVNLATVGPGVAVRLMIVPTSVDISALTATALEVTSR